MEKSFPKDFGSVFRKNIWYGIIFICLLGSLFHFVFDLSGKQPAVGLFAPVNESVFEHLKLAFYPTFIWWALSYFVLKRKYQLYREKWFVSAVLSSVISPLFILSFYYTYTGAFGFESMVLDVLSLFFGAILGQFVAGRFYRYARLKKFYFYLAVSLFVLMFAGFSVFTFFPPRLPLFQEP